MVGLRSWCVALSQHDRGYPTDEVLLSPDDGWPARERKRLGLFGRALRDYDVIHFNSGQTLFPSFPAAGYPVRAGYGAWALRLHRSYASLLGMNDLRLLRRAHKAIVATFQGDDARHGHSWGKPGSTFEVDLEAEAGYYVPGWDEGRARVVDRFAASADRIYYGSPDLAPDLPEWATFMPVANIDPTLWKPRVFNWNENDRLRIVHAPSVRGVKGTSYVLAATERLRNEGHDFELVLVEGASHAEARKIYESAHVVIDQLLLGWYGGLAVEAMSLAKPVVAHIRESGLRFVPDEMTGDLPVLRATRESIYDVLREILTTPRERLAEIGAAGRGYVERWHDPLKVAQRLKEDYETILRDKKKRG
jgi:glycosyltransferase involved in cell wall biosynthesis